MTQNPYLYNIFTGNAVRQATGIPIRSNAGLLGWNSRGYRQRINLHRVAREQKVNPLLTGSRATINNGFKNSGKLICIKFENSGWSLSIYKDGGFWINGFKKTKKDIDMIFGYMSSRHNRNITYDEAEELFINVIKTDIDIAQTFINKLSYTFYNDKNEEVETMLNIEQTGKEEVSIELNDGLWVSMNFKNFKSFMRGCGKNKNKWMCISPEELYHVQTGKYLSDSQTKLIHAFLEQNRRSALVEKRSMELIQDLEKRFSGRIKNITIKEYNTGRDEFDEFPAMFIKGKQLDWVVFSRAHPQHRNGTQDVSTYCIVSKKNYEYDEDSGMYRSKNETLAVQSGSTKSEVFFWGPICIDQTNLDVSLGDQYAARALALLNDKASMNMVSTLNTYSRYEPEIRVDIDALSELSKY